VTSPAGETACPTRRDPAARDRDPNRRSDRLVRRARRAAARCGPGDRRLYDRSLCASLTRCSRRDATWSSRAWRRETFCGAGRSGADAAPPDLTADAERVGNRPHLAPAGTGKYSAGAKRTTRPSAIAAIVVAVVKL